MVNEIRRIAIECINPFECLLADKNINIPSEDREGNEEEACLYGSEYYEVEDRITDILTTRFELIEKDLINLCEDNEVMIETIKEYFKDMKKEDFEG